MKNSEMQSRAVSRPFANNIPPRIPRGILARNAKRSRSLKAQRRREGIVIQGGNAARKATMKSMKRKGRH